MNLKHKGKLLNEVIKGRDNKYGLTYFYVNSNGEWYPCQTNVLSEYQFTFRLCTLSGRTKVEMKNYINQMEAEFLRVVQ